MVLKDGKRCLVLRELAADTQTLHINGSFCVRKNYHPFHQRNKRLLGSDGCNDSQGMDRKSKQDGAPALNVEGS